MIHWPVGTEKQTRLTAQLALGVCVLAITYLALAPLDQVPVTSNDKLNHILAFGVLAWLAETSYPGRSLAPYRWAALLGYGLLIEVVQGFLPFRDFSLADLAADAAGILLYTLIASVRRRRAARESSA